MIRRFPRLAMARFPRLLHGRKDRAGDGALLCFCGKRHLFYSGKHKRGFCSDECYQFFDDLERRIGGLHEN